MTLTLTLSDSDLIALDELLRVTMTDHQRLRVRESGPDLDYAQRILRARHILGLDHARDIQGSGHAPPPALSDSVP